MVPTIPLPWSGSTLAVQGSVSISEKLQSSPLTLVLESINDFIEMPINIYEAFLPILLANGNFQIASPHHGGGLVLNNCRASRLSIHLPAVIYDIGVSSILVFPRSYLVTRPSLGSNQCVLLVRPAMRESVLRVGTPFLSNAMLAVPRSDGAIPTIYICNA